MSDYPAALDFHEPRPLPGSGAEDQIDMTPMVDVTFLLLIFFMITAVFALQKAMDVPPVPEETYAASPSTEDVTEDTVTVRIDGDNVFWIAAPRWDEEQRAPSNQEMRVKLRAARSGEEPGDAAGPARLLVQASGDAIHEKVVAALDAGMAVGMEDIQLMTYEDEQ